MQLCFTCTIVPYPMDICIGYCPTMRAICSIQSAYEVISRATGPRNDVINKLYQTSGLKD